MFADNLKRILKEKGITQKELAELIGTSCNVVNRWFTEHREPTLYFVYKICEVLKVTPNDLLGCKPSLLADYSTNALLAEIKRRTRM